MSKGEKRRPQAEHGFASGFHAVTSLVRQNPGSVRSVCVDRNRRDQRMKRLIELVRSLGIAVQSMSRKELAGLGAGEKNQGVVAMILPQAAAAPTVEDLLAAADDTACFLILDGVQDPGNFGACLRSAEAAGVDAVIVPRDGSCPLNETVRKTSAGAAAVIPVVTVTNLARTVERLKQAGVWMVGTSAAAEIDIYDVDLTVPVALIMGSEGAGIRKLVESLCDYLVRLPLQGTINSLNVSAATAVALFEVVRQRR